MLQQNLNENLQNETLSAQKQTKGTQKGSATRMLQTD